MFEDEEGVQSANKLPVHIIQSPNKSSVQDTQSLNRSLPEAEQ